MKPEGRERELYHTQDSHHLVGLIRVSHGSSIVWALSYRHTRTSTHMQSRHLTVY